MPGWFHENEQATIVCIAPACQEPDDPGLAEREGLGLTAFRRVQPGVSPKSKQPSPGGHTLPTDIQGNICSVTDPMYGVGAPQPSLNQGSGFKTPVALKHRTLTATAPVTEETRKRNVCSEPTVYPVAIAGEHVPRC
jgi:hypothetical protein